MNNETGFFKVEAFNADVAALQKDVAALELDVLEAGKLWRVDPEDDNSSTKPSKTPSSDVG